MFLSAATFEPTSFKSRHLPRRIFSTCVSCSRWRRAGTGGSLVHSPGAAEASWSHPRRSLPFLRRAKMSRFKEDLFDCNRLHDWLSSMVWSTEDQGERLRQLISFDFINLQPNTGARKLLKLATTRAEWVDTLCVVIRESKVILSAFIQYNAFSLHGFVLINTSQTFGAVQPKEIRCCEIIDAAKERDVLFLRVNCVFLTILSIAQLTCIREAIKDTRTSCGCTEPRRGVCTAFPRLSLLKWVSHALCRQHHTWLFVIFKYHRDSALVIQLNFAVTLDLLPLSHPLKPIFVG